MSNSLDKRSFLTKFLLFYLKFIDILSGNKKALGSFYYFTMTKSILLKILVYKKMIKMTSTSFEEKKKNSRLNNPIEY